VHNSDICKGDSTDSGRENIKNTVRFSAVFGKHGQCRLEWWQVLWSQTERGTQKKAACVGWQANGDKLPQIHYNFLNPIFY
jgi:hypothetical protein